ncbi:ClbS/DfsB family four-helix bundle protein [Lactobacillus sp. ESL0731]|uniref:ClbS/DfsB family four-helix bundle protein n=1 Tax=unclassified Lactobacillus TaxID=2620435 RepID=UPI0023F72153|nr:MULTISPECIES: ClbS/DfsB family four-helix bundle protein [unclassified Lactobacillus]WEV51429.1 ClbS/DfsB family four-helix bundle protein [Lactobacillus sp. ESL0700]WEV62559.1 ClbS/DfsB family four-helix bundle protein [Lactobacillus sp. ESL0731]
MKTYANKDELVNAIRQSYQKYITEFTDVPERLKDKRIEEVDKTPSENLAYQLGWLNLLLEWEEKEKRGLHVQTPTDEYKWNQLGDLYQSFYQKYGKQKLTDQVQELNQKVEEVCAWVDTLSEQELFEPGQRQWATTKAMWPLYKFIHINTVAPFTNFRTKIRKWKRLVLQ